MGDMPPFNLRLFNRFSYSIFLNQTTGFRFAFYWLNVVAVLQLLNEKNGVGNALTSFFGAT